MFITLFKEVFGVKVSGRLRLKAINPEQMYWATLVVVAAAAEPAEPGKQ